MLNNYIENKYLEKYASEMEKEAGLLGKLALTGLMAGAGTLAYKKGLPSLVKYFGTESGEQALGKGVSFLKEKGLWQPKSFPIGVSDFFGLAHSALDSRNPWAKKYRGNEEIQKGLDVLSRHLGY